MSNEILMSQFANSLGVIGGMSRAFSTIRFGRDKRAAAEFEAAQLEQQAGQAQASAQRAEYFEGRNADYAMSDALAKAAASGGGASDPTVINIIAGIAQEGAYREQTALYQGDDKARALRLHATAREFEGQSAEAAGMFAGLSEFARVGSRYVRGEAYTEALQHRQASNLLAAYQPGSTLFQRFGGDGPPQLTRY